MRILVLAPQPFYQDRGTPIALRHLLEAWSRLGYEADVLTFPVGADVSIPGVRIRRIGNPFGIRSVPIGFSLKKLVLDVQMAFALRRHLRRHAGRYACIHAVEEAAFLGVLIGRRYRLPVIYDMQSSLPEQLRNRWPFSTRVAQWCMRGCEQWLLKRSALVMCSAGLAAHVRRSSAATRVREWWFPVTVPDVADTELAALRLELAIPESARVVLYSGTFEPYQGLPQLLGAVQTIRERVPETVFVLVGRDGPAGEAVARQAHALGLLDGGVRMLPRQSRDRMPAFLALADVLVSPRTEGANLPLKIYEYLASGRPIVATDLPVHRPVLDAARAVLVAPTSAHLADGVVQLLLNEPQRRRLATAARQYAHARWSEERFVRWVGALYRGLGDLEVARAADNAGMAYAPVTRPRVPA
jgi:glycosyltransferase involved in cell wall biosynthesis